MAVWCVFVPVLLPLHTRYFVTVEDPSEGFVALRDMLDCQNCQTLPNFQPPMIHQAFTDATATVVREKFKINKVQYLKNKPPCN